MEGSYLVSDRLSSNVAVGKSDRRLALNAKKISINKSAAMTTVLMSYRMVTEYLLFFMSAGRLGSLVVSFVLLVCLLCHLVIVITAGPLPAPARTWWLHRAVDLALRQSPHQTAVVIFFSLCGGKSRRSLVSGPNSLVM